MPRADPRPSTARAFNQVIDNKAPPSSPRDVSPPAETTYYDQDTSDEAAKIRATIEVAIMLHGTSSYDKARDMALEAGWENDRIVHCIHEKFDWTAKKEPLHNHVPNDDEEENTSQSRVSYAKYKEMVQSDVKVLIEAAREGSLFVSSWRKQDDPSNVIIIKFPAPMNDFKVDLERCKILHKLLPNDYVTLLHNSLASYHQDGSFAMAMEWCHGFNATVSPYDVEFLGDDICFNTNLLFDEIYNGSDVNLQECKPGDLTTEEMERYQESGGSEYPPVDIRVSDGYKNMNGWRETMPCYDKIKEKIGEKRFDEMVHWFRSQLFDFKEYIKKRQGLHVLLPALWLPQKAIISCPHLFRAFDRKLQAWQRRHQERDAESDENEQDADDDADTGNGIEGEEGEENNVRKYRDVWNDRYTLFCHAYHDETLKNSVEKEFVSWLNNCVSGEVGIMAMNQGKLEGALRDTNESWAHCYASVNMIRAAANYLRKGDRYDKYAGKGFDMKVITIGDMKEARAISFHLHNLHKFQTRMKLPPVVNKSIMFSIGKGDQPISNMTAVMYMNNYVKCPLEAHRIYFIEGAYTRLADKYSD